MGGLEHAGIRLRGGEAQCILFSFVKQVEVEFLLDVLLAFDGEHLALLARNLRHACGGLASTVGDIVDFGADVGVHVVNGAHDVLPHCIKRLVKVLNHGVVFTTATFKEFVATKFGCVVLADLVFDRPVADTGIGGNQFGGFRRITQVVTQIEAGLLLEHEVFYLGAVTLALAD